MELLNTKENPFAGFLEKLQKEGKKVNPVHEVVNFYFRLIDKEKESKSFYKGRYAYGKLAAEAKRLLEACNNDLDDAMWAVDKMKYKADKGGFDWSIITCLKHKLTWG